jgi:hypothetical protein
MTTTITLRQAEEDAAAVYCPNVAARAGLAAELAGAIQQVFDGARLIDSPKGRVALSKAFAKARRMGMVL